MTQPFQINVHKEVDKMEHSFTTFDPRSIPLSDIHDVINDSRLRDRTILIPSNYELPAINVDVLSKLDVRCTWEDGDYVGEQSSFSMVLVVSPVTLVENDDKKVYLVSDNSSSRCFLQR